MDPPTLSDGALIRALEWLPFGLGWLMFLMHTYSGHSVQSYRSGVKSVISHLIFQHTSVVVYSTFYMVTIAGLFWETYRKKRMYSEYPPLRPKPMKNRCSWMKEFQHFTMLDLSVPGSHDAHAIRGNLHDIAHPKQLFSPLGNTQEYSLYDQLRFGIRAFDFRLCTDKHGIIPMLAHGPGMRYQTLDSALDEIRCFTKKYPSEVVMITVKVEERNRIPRKKEIEIYPKSFEKLRHHLIGPELIDVPIGEITKGANKNIILVAFREDTTKLFESAGSTLEYWDYSLLHKSWENTDSPKVLEKRIKDTVDRAKEQPIRRHLLWLNNQMTMQCLVGEVLAIINPLLGEAYSFQMRQVPLSGFVNLEEMAFVSNRITLCLLLDGLFAGARMNIISQDFIHDDVIEAIIDLNRNKELHIR